MNLLAFSRRSALRSFVFLACVLAVFTSTVRAADEAAVAKRKEAIAKGLARLSERVRGDKLPDPELGGGTAVRAFAGLAFLAAGSTTEQGDYAADVRICFDQILKSADEKTGAVVGRGSLQMYDHGFATLFLAEVYATLPAGERKGEVGKVLERAVGLIAKAQNREGGWRYVPKPFDADVSVSACQTVALTVAQRAGIKLPEGTLDRAIAYLHKCQNDDGGFRYMAASNSASGFPRSAAGAAALAHAEGADSKEAAKAVKYLSAGVAQSAGEGHFSYGRYYAGQFLHLAGDASKESYAALCDDLLKKQDAGGGWRGDFNDDYATATALIALQAPQRKLALFTAQQAAPAPKPAAADAPPAAVQASPAAQAKLAVVREYFAITERQRNAGLGGFDAEGQHLWSVRLMNAERDVAAADAAAGRAAVERHLERMKNQAKTANELFGVGQLSRTDVLACEYFVAEAQGWVGSAGGK